MNEQIFDWSENSEKVLSTKQYTTFHSRFREQVAVVRYLLDKGYDKEGVYEQWKSTKPHEIEFAEEEHEKRKAFGRVWGKAKKWTNYVYGPITIYQEELDFINNMSVLLWVKQYILTLLCVYKYYRQPWCCYTNRIKCFCYSQTYVQNERAEFTLKLCDCVRQYNPYSTVIHDCNVAFRINFYQEVGTPLETIKNPTCTKELFKYLKDTRTCSACGKVFETFSTLRRTLCDDCYRKMRYKKQVDLKRERRRRKRGQQMDTIQ